MMRGWGLALAVVLLGAVGGAVSQEPRPDAEEHPAVTAVSTSLDIEQALLAEDREAYGPLVRKRDDAVARWNSLHSAIDAAVNSDEPGAAAMLERLLGQLEQAEGERAELQSSVRGLAERIRDRMRRVRMLEERLALLRERPEDRPGGLLAGTWNVVLLPAGQRGTFVLEQSGAVVTGTYRLSGGFSGSLRGTLVQTKVYLERIDSRLGRSMEFEGRLSGDASQIRGTWQSFELADGDGANGHWSATRRSSRDPDKPADEEN